MAKYQQEDNRRHSAIQNLLKMFHISNTPTVPLNSEEDMSGEAEEPPDEPVSPLHMNSPAISQEQQPQQKQQPPTYTKSAPPPLDRKESLLTRALLTGPNAAVPSPLPSPVPGALSRASTFSNASMPSMGELTSDGDDTSPTRSATPSPPLPSSQFHPLETSNKTSLAPTHITFVNNREQVMPMAVDAQESKVEANLGRKRAIKFACADPRTAKETPPVKEESVAAAQPPKRKSAITFACPTRPTQTSDRILEPPKSRRDGGKSPTNDNTSHSKDQPKVEKQESTQSPTVATSSADTTTDTVKDAAPPHRTDSRPLETPSFHEFATSNDQDDAWVHEPVDSHHKLTLSDCMKKEAAIRKIGEEAEAEAEQEEKEQDDYEDENDDGDNEDDFAPSDDGNESDNEAGFAESDDDSDAESDDQFWVPSSTTAATSLEHISPVRPMPSRRQSGSSADSHSEHEIRRQKTSESVDIKGSKPRRPSKLHHLRTSTPELPDSTDFVCGTLDEDRPLEAAYISCREQKKREKHIPIPQDIDPSFPTTDPEEMDEEDDEDLEIPEDHLWLEDQLEGFDDDSRRTQASKHAKKKPTLRSPRRVHSPPPKHGAHRSPPPPRQTTRRPSPAPNGRLFSHSPTRLHSPPPLIKLRSPPGTRRPSPSSTIAAMTHQPQGLGISRGLAQRPYMTRTSSLPRTPNPFFRNYHTRNQANEGVDFGGVTPGQEMHVRGPIDIVIGLEKKRQKRKEKFLRQHCRKAAKEQAERRPIPGKGAERMRELGLECAERTRGYGLGQQAPLVISL